MSRVLLDCVYKYNFNVSASVGSIVWIVYQCTDLSHVKPSGFPPPISEVILEKRHFTSILFRKDRRKQQSIALALDGITSGISDF
jgi:hypothetical protein